MNPLDIAGGILSPIGAIASIFAADKQKDALKQQQKLNKQQIQLQREAAIANIAYQKRRNQMLAYSAVGLGAVILTVVLITKAGRK